MWHSPLSINNIKRHRQTIYHHRSASTLDQYCSNNDLRSINQRNTSSLIKQNTTQLDLRSHHHHTTTTSTPKEWSSPNLSSSSPPSSPPRQHWLSSSQRIMRSKSQFILTSKPNVLTEAFVRRLQYGTGAANKVKARFDTFQRTALDSREGQGLRGMK